MMFNRLPILPEYCSTKLIIAARRTPNYQPINGKTAACTNEYGATIVPRIAIDQCKIFKGDIRPSSARAQNARGVAAAQRHALTITVLVAVDPHILSQDELAPRQCECLALHSAAEHDRVRVAVALARATASRRLSSPSFGSTRSAVVVTVNVVIGIPPIFVRPRTGMPARRMGRTLDMIRPS